MIDRFELFGQPLQSALQRFYGAFGNEILRAIPSQDLSRIPIHDQAPGFKSFLGPKIGDVTNPNFVRCILLEILHKIPVQRQRMIRVCGTGHFGNTLFQTMNLSRFARFFHSHNLFQNVPLSILPHSPRHSRWAPDPVSS